MLFIGYQAEGTMGRHILEGADHVRIMGEDIAVRARIESIDGFSAHADQQELLTWIRQIKAPRMTFLMHGEDDVLAVFSQFLQTELGLKTYAPRYGDTVVLGKEGWQVSAQREQIIGGDLGELYATLSAVEEAYRRYREQLEQTLREHPDQAAAAKRKLTKMQRYMQKTLGEI